MINGASVLTTMAHNLAMVEEVVGELQTSDKLREYDSHIQAHIVMLETAIDKTSDPSEKEKGRAAIRRLRAGLGTLKK